MKRDSYARNEESENKRTSQVSGRCWATLVNNQGPCGGNTQSQQRLLAGLHPPPPVFGLKFDETSFPARKG